MNRLRKTAAAALLYLPILSGAFAYPAAAPVEPLCAQDALAAPDWIRNRTIYEVNVRQFSKDGTFAAVEADLDRIHDLGIGVIWLMPIHPIGKTNRKGQLGSYYSVADYQGINPEFGDAESFRSLVGAAHARDMKVIIDWVGNHTAWDHPWAKSNPQFYERNEDGNFTPPRGTDWTDVIQLDFGNRDLWDAMSRAMEYWVAEFAIDGFRCDYAVGPPTKFWNFVSAKLREIEPELYLLAESETPDLNLHAFHSSYGWPMHSAFNAVAQGKASASSIIEQYRRQNIEFPAGTLLLYYTTNHDENSWNGTTAERMGAAKRAFDTLAFTLPGVPLIYNGQEASLAKRLEFFERDPIDWSDLGETAFYQKLTSLRANVPAISAPDATFSRIPSDQDGQVLAFTRISGGSQVTYIANLSANPTRCYIADEKITGSHADPFTGEITTLGFPAKLDLEPWEFHVLVR